MVGTADCSRHHHPTYTVLGGLYAVLCTGMVQGLILIFGMLVFAPMIVMYVGWLEHINTVLTGNDPNFEIHARSWNVIPHMPTDHLFVLGAAGWW